MAKQETSFADTWQYDCGWAATAGLNLMNYTNLGEELQKRRWASGLSLRAFSNLVGLPVDVLAEMEKGSASSGLLELLSVTEALQIPLISLFEQLETVEDLNQTGFCHASWVADLAQIRKQITWARERRTLLTHSKVRQSMDRYLKSKSDFVSSAGLLQNTIGRLLGADLGSIRAWAEGPANTPVMSEQTSSVSYV